MDEKVLGLNKEMLLENMQWQHERLKTGKRATSAENELLEWIERIQSGKFDVPVVSVEEIKEFRLKKLREMLSNNGERKFGNGYLCALDELAEAIRLQAKKEAKKKFNNI